MFRSSTLPWGATVAGLGLQRFTGQLNLAPEHPQTCIAFDRGYIVGATSPLPIDSVTRVALTNHLISPTQIVEVQKRVAATPRRDEVDMLVEVTRLAPERAIALRKRVVTQRAARTFSYDTEYVIEDRITIPRHATCQVDVRAVVFLGALTNLTPERLAHDLRQFPPRFKLLTKAIRDLPRFEIPDSALAILHALRAPTSLPELEAVYRDVDPRLIQAVVYALLACDACAPDERRSQPMMAPPDRTAMGTTEATPLVKAMLPEREPVTEQVAKSTTAHAPSDAVPSERMARGTTESEPMQVTITTAPSAPRAVKGTAESPPQDRPSSARLPTDRMALPPLTRATVPQPATPAVPEPDAKPPLRTVQIPRTKTKKPRETP